MQGVTEPRVDREGVKAQVTKASQDLERPRVWILRWTWSFGLFLAVLKVPVVMSQGWAVAFGVPSALYTGAVAVAIATGSTWVGRRLARRSEAEFVASVQREWLWLTGPGWVRRSVLSGIVMGAGIGVVVGSLLAWVLEVPFHPARFVLLFIGLTLAWTIPMAFGIRHVAMRQHRRFVLVGE